MLHEFVHIEIRTDKVGDAQLVRLAPDHTRTGATHIRCLEREVRFVLPHIHGHHHNCRAFTLLRRALSLGGVRSAVVLQDKLKVEGIAALVNRV